jgi:hypothetical protein
MNPGRGRTCGNRFGGDLFESIHPASTQEEVTTVGSERFCGGGPKPGGGTRDDNPFFAKFHERIESEIHRKVRQNRNRVS